MRYYRSFNRLARVAGDWERCEAYHWTKQTWVPRNDTDIRFGGDWDLITEAEALAHIQQYTLELATTT